MNRLGGLVCESCDPPKRPSDRLGSLRIDFGVWVDSQVVHDEWTQPEGSWSVTGDSGFGQGGVGDYSAAAGTSLASSSAASGQEAAVVVSDHDADPVAEILDAAMELLPLTRVERSRIEYAEWLERRSDEEITKLMRMPVWPDMFAPRLVDPAQVSRRLVCVDGRGGQRLIRWADEPLLPGERLAADSASKNKNENRNENEGEIE